MHKTVAEYMINESHKDIPTTEVLRVSSLSHSVHPGMSRCEYTVAEKLFFYMGVSRSSLYLRECKF